MRPEHDQRCRWLRHTDTKHDVQGPLARHKHCSTQYTALDSLQGERKTTGDIADDSATTYDSFHPIVSVLLYVLRSCFLPESPLPQQGGMERVHPRPQVRA